MARKYLLPLFVLLVLPAVLLASCAGKSKAAADPPLNSAELELSQMSVVNTSLDSSFQYQQFSSYRSEGPVIPGLLQPLVPQGMAYWPEADLMIISNYMSDGSAGVLTIVEMNEGGLEKALFLYNIDDTPHTGHLGGLAVSTEHLWIASGAGVYYLSLAAIKAAEDKDEILLPKIIETETKASFATYNDGILWIGEFTRADRSYPALKTHQITASDGNTHLAWLGGYKLKVDTDLLYTENTVSSRLIPDYILSIPNEIQGAVFFDGKILLSASYGRRNDSRLIVFSNPLTKPPHAAHEFQANADVPVRFLDDNNRIAKIIAPPMSEAVVLYEEKIAVLFESAASKYRSTAKSPLDRLQFLDL